MTAKASSDSEQAGPQVIIPEPPLVEPPKGGLPPGRGFIGSIREVIADRQILANFVRRDFAAQHRNSFLGFLWSLLNPLLLVAVFTLVFKVLRADPQGSGGAPFSVFFFCGLTIWHLFSNSIQGSTSSVVGSRHLIQKVYFPREILPLAIVLSNAITFLFESVVLVLAITIFYDTPGPKAPLAVLPVVVIMILAYGIGLILATVNVYFRDVEHFVAILLLAWFWFSGVIFDLSWVRSHGHKAYLVFVANPLVGIVDSFRKLLLYDSWPNWALLGYSTAFALASVIIGMLVFNRYERAFAELV
jgi:ABC-type polysaccharide/polyol phosphate export permease